MQHTSIACQSMLRGVIELVFSHNCLSELLRYLACQDTFAQLHRTRRGLGLKQLVLLCAASSADAYMGQLLHGLLGAQSTPCTMTSGLAC